MIPPPVNYITLTGDALHLFVHSDSLKIRAEAINGTIPSTFGKLTLLKSMDLGGAANMTGPLPSELGYLSLLLDLGFRGSGVTGTVPTEFGRLSDLGKYSVNLLLSAWITVDRYIILASH
jgi:hypothetical protein